MDTDSNTPDSWEYQNSIYSYPLQDMLLLVICMSFLILAFTI